MPIDYSLYPLNWKAEIRPAILKRADNKCEVCGVKNGAKILRGTFHDREVYMTTYMELFDTETGNRVLFDSNDDPQFPESNKVIKIVLTIAHTCNDSMCADESHLKALCQLHHLRRDGLLHSQTRRATRAKKMGLIDLFENQKT